VTVDGGVTLGHVETSVHGRYLLRRAAAEPAPLVVGFHGYGFGAGSMLAELMEIPGIGDWHLASVQGLHRFYNRRNEEVVASWMTRQDRELAIADNVAYVGRALDAIGDSVRLSGPSVYIGFSQGASMAYRAAAGSGRRCDGIVALVGDAPPDLAVATTWGRPPVLIGGGTRDAWYNEAKWQADERLLEGLGSTVDVCVFEGGHEWTGAFRRRTADFLAKVRA
jgi:predicted esterase